MAGIVLANYIFAGGGDERGGSSAKAAAAATPADLGLEYQSWAWRTKRDRVRLVGWYIPGTGPDAVLVCHGMGQAKDSVLPHCRLLHEAGFHVLAYDSRNHGDSGRNWRRWSLASRFTNDLVDGLERLRAEPRITGTVSVLAFSFSAWPALRAARREGAAIDAVVCDSGPVLDIRAAVARLARLRAVTLPAWADRPAGRAALTASAAWTVSLMLGERGWPPRRPGPPVLLVTGGRDRILPAEEILDFAAALPDTQTWMVPRAGHIRAVRSDPDGYARTVVGFLPRAGCAPARSAVPVPVPGEEISRA